MPQFSHFLQTPWVSRYKFAGRMTGHTNAIHALAMSRKGRYLASGGSDGVKLWDMKTYDQLMCPKQGHIVRGPISCMLWISRRNEASETLCYGTGLGYLVFWCQNPRDVRANIADL
jgi:WD40 repeat protein